MKLVLQYKVEQDTVHYKKNILRGMRSSKDHKQHSKSLKSNVSRNE